MYNEFGTVVALVHIYVPFMVLTLTGVIGRIDERLEQAARSLGAGRLRAFVEVTLPLSLPGILAGSLLVFALVDQRLCHALADGRHRRADLADADRPAGRHQLQSELRRRAGRHPAAGLPGDRRSPTTASWPGCRASRGWHERRRRTSSRSMPGARPISR